MSSPISIKAEIAFSAVLLSLGASGGYVAATRWFVNDISGARSDTAVCKSAIDSKDAAIKTLTGKLGDLQARHDAMIKAATQGLDDRDARIKELEDAAHKRRAAISEKPHDAQCASLDNLPLCPGIARELWPAAAAADSGNQAAGH